MKKQHFTLGWLLAALWIVSTGSSLSAQKSYKLDAFDEISITGNVEARLVRGDTNRVVVETYGMPEEEVNVYVSQQTLKIGLLNSIFYKNARARVVITYQNVHAIRGYAGAKITADQSLETERLELRAGSGAQVSLEIKTNKLEGSATEGGILKLTGEAESQKAHANTGGQYQAFGLECKNTYARAGTGGQVEVIARETLDAYANLGGSIEYRGDPTHKGNRKVLGGEVRQNVW